MAVSAKGIDVRQSTSHILFRASLKDSSGTKLATGTTTMTLYEYQSDGTFKSYDFNDNTFKTTALTTATLALTHRQGNNNTTNTGVWTVALSTLTGFTSGAVYMVQINNSGAIPTDQEREFQFGSAEGDLAVTSTGYLKTDTEEWKGGTIPADNITGIPLVDLKYILGTLVTSAAVNADGFDLEESLRLLLAAMAGKVSGGGTSAETFRAADDSKARITATVDSSGNRTAITLDAT